MDFAGLIQATVLSGMAVSVITEIMKSKYLPVPAMQHPRVTALVLSVGASGYEVYRYNQVNFVTLSWPGWVALTGFTLLVSALTYNQILKVGAKT